MRELAIEEVDNVSGGAIPLGIIAIWAADVALLSAGAALVGNIISARGNSGSGGGSGGSSGTSGKDEDS